MDQGWVSLHRKIWNHWLVEKNRPLTKFEAWLKILTEVNHKEKKVMIKGQLYNIERGESLNSLDTWAKLFNWNKSKVRRFFKLLESDSMLVQKSERKTTRIKICNYDSYQDVRHSDETQMKRKRNANETQMTPNNNDNNELIKKIIIYLNETADKKFKSSSRKTITHINARLNEGFVYDDFKSVVDSKVIDWVNDPKMNEYLRPETLFGTKFEGYLNSRSIEEPRKIKNETTLNTKNVNDRWKQ